MFKVDEGCPHYAGGYCTWLSEFCGRAEYATGPRCERDCQREKPTSLALQVLPSEHGGAFLARTVGKYTAGPQTVAVPEWWPEFASVLVECGAVQSEHVEAIYLTGSGIVESNPDPKDIDVVLLVQDVEAGQAVKALVPRVWRGKKVDVWVHTRRSPYYPMLDPVEQVLYMPPFAAPKLMPAKGIKVVQGNLSEWTPAARRVLRALHHKAGVQVAATRKEERAKLPQQQAKLLAQTNAGIKPRKPCGACSRARKAK